MTSPDDELRRLAAEGRTLTPFPGRRSTSREELALMRHPNPIPGVDMDEALLTVGDADLLEDLFEQMARTWGDGARRISRALQEDDGAGRAAAVAHALWGVAATLAVHRVREAAARIEEALRASKVPTLEPELKELEEALSAFVEAVRVWKLGRSKGTAVSLPGGGA